VGANSRELLQRTPVILLAALLGFVLSGIRSPLAAQPAQCDPAKVVTSASCAKCHIAEFNVWRQTPHAQTLETLHRNPQALEIAKRLGQTSIKRNDICLDCHYTSQMTDGASRVVEGISCEACHGAARDWIHVHSDYGGPTVNAASESEQHRLERIKRSIDFGMRNPKNVYSIARSCLQCHTVPNENLVNVGGHAAGSSDFEFVRWSQGIVRHNFLHSPGGVNEPSPVQRLRVMYISGLIADLEFSTRGTALATNKSTYGKTVAARAASVAMRLYEIQVLIRDPHLQQILESFSTAELRTNNAEQLTAIADRIAELGFQFAEAADGHDLVAIDKFLPSPADYR
jgi:hypothetical protein